MAAANAKVSRATKRTPTFFWQGLLIILPVILLAGVGFFSLRQDKFLAKHEASERAQRLAEEITQNLWAELTEAKQSNGFGFQVDRAGQLIYPPAYSALPHPVTNALARLTSEQDKLWRTAQNPREDIASAISACKTFLDRSPLGNFTGQALYTLGTLYSRAGEVLSASN